MAKPRVFLSSTYYDLKQIRADIEKFIKEMGYEPVLNEHGNIPYGKEDSLEEYCYREIQFVDIVVSIIGGRFGTESNHSGNSISQIEVKTALEDNKQVYIFIQKAVDNEYNLWCANKEITTINYPNVDNAKVFEFIDQIRALPNNNQIATFETATDIIYYLKEQWAGLFQRFLQDQAQVTEKRILKDIIATAQILNQLVNYFNELGESNSYDQTVNGILLINHPVFQQIKELTLTPYRVFFTTRTELEGWLKARSWTPVDEEAWDDVDFIEYHKKSKSNISYLHVAKNLFDENGQLKNYYNDETLSSTKLAYITIEEIPSDDDIPF